jgi:predicted regulator of Ras-like GTPase activity (Roadblock/LC7/MglB family)
MSGPRDQAQAALDELVNGAGLLGAGIASRDGLPILLRFKRPIQEETFCAMAAAFFGAAEAALQEMSADAPSSAVIETGSTRLQISGIDNTHLLIVAAPLKVQTSGLQAAAEKGRKALQAILGG